MLVAAAVPASANHQFDDVAAQHPFHGEISWLVDEGITDGYPDGEFKPANPVSRQAAAAFLYREDGEPAGPWTSNFSDVASTHPFYDEISWAAAQDITDGYGDGTFKPGNVVTRQAAMAFMFRAAGEPAGPWSSDFDDVPSTHAFYDEISWGAEQGITGGYADGEFKPGNVVTRQAIAAFMYRTAGPPGCDADLSTTSADLPNGREATTQEWGDLDGDGRSDRLSTYKVSLGGGQEVWTLHVLTASGYATDVKLAQAGSLANVRPLGTVAIGDGFRAAMVVEDVGASNELVSLWGLHDWPNDPCDLGRLTVGDDDAPMTYPVGGTAGQGAYGLRCDEIEGFPVIAATTLTPMGDQFEWTTESMSWMGHGALTIVGNDQGQVPSSGAGAYAGINCPSMSSG